MNRTRVPLIAAIVLLLFAAALPGLAQNTLTVTPTSLTFFAPSGSATPQSRTLEISSSGPAGTAVGYLAGASAQGGAWLSVSPQSGTTPATVSVTANPASLQAGTYQGSVTISIAGTNLTVPVTLNVGPIGAVPAQVAFNYQAGGAVPGSQVVSLSSAAQTGFTAAASTTTGGNWLQVAPSNGTTPATLSITLDATVLATLTQGTYQGAVTVTPTGAGQVPTSIPVTLTVTPVPRLNISPASLSFGYQIGGTSNTIQQPLTLTSTAGQLNFAVVVTTQTGGNWLVVTPTSGVTPTTLTVGVQPPMTPGVYNGTITINAPGAATQTQQVSVSLTVSNNPLLSLSPNALTYTHQFGTAAPAAQTITPQSTGAALTYTVGATTANGGSWIVIDTPAGTTPTPISISVNPTGLSAGTYNGTVTVTAAGAGNPPQQVPVTLRVSNEALVTVNSSTAPAAIPFVYQTGGVVPAPQSFSIGSSTGAVLNFGLAATTASGGNWLTVTPASGTTPGNFVVTANPAGVAAGNYDGTITVTAINPATGAAAPNSPLTIPVKFFVSNNALLNVSENAITLSSVNNLVTPQTVSLTSTGEQLGFTVSFTTSSGGPWLTLGPASGTTPALINVSAVPGSLAPGNYAGTVTIAATNPGGAAVANSPTTIPVNLTVAAGSLQVSPASMTFSMPAGGSTPAQNISIGSTGGILVFNAAATTETGGNWLSVTPNTGGTPGQVAVSVNGAGLAQGIYRGAVTISSPGAANSPQTVQVTLNIGAAQTLHASPSTLTFSHQVGSATPAGQTVALSSTGGSLNYVATVTTTSGGQWLAVSPATGSTPGNLNVTVNPTGLQAGRYQGVVSIASAGAANGPQTVAVVLNVTALPPPVLTAVTNAASGATGFVAPGEIVAIYGTNIGPETLTEYRLVQGRLDTALADTQVLFSNIPAPLLYVSANQIGAIVPYELFGRVTTRVQIRHRGVTSSEVELWLANSQPGVFTINQTGSGQGAILNQDFSVNSASNPAARGSAVMIYATGEGQTDPHGVSGKIMPNTLDGLATPLLPVSVAIGGRRVEAVYAGSAPGNVAGLFQVNVIIPDDAPTGAAVPVVVTVGEFRSQSGVTLAVR